MLKMVWILAFCVARVLPAENLPPDRAYIHLNNLPTPHAEVRVEGQRSNQTGINRQFMTPPLPNDTEYLYDIEITAPNADGINQTVRITVRFRRGQTVEVDASTHFANRRDIRNQLPTPREQPARQSVPLMLRHNEALSNLYQEYTNNRRVPTLQDLKPEDRKGFQCEIYSISRDGGLDRKKITFQSASTGRGRHVTVRMGDPQNDQATNFLLVKNDTQGWRGSASTPHSRRAISGSETMRLMGRANAPWDGWMINGEELDRHSSLRVSASLFHYACINNNKDNDHELYIELGSKILGVFEGGRGNRYFTRNSEIDFGSTANLARNTTVGRTFDVFPVALGMVGQPRSICFDDDPEALVIYRMTSLGHCDENKE